MSGNGNGSRGQDGLELACAPRRAAAARMRRDLRAYLARQPLERRAVHELVLAAQEAFINAVIHAHDADGVILVSACVNDDQASIEVRDVGCGFDARACDLELPPSADECRGRGLFLIRSVMDEVEIRSSGAGTTVHMTRRMA